MAKINFNIVINRLVDLFKNKNTYIFLICVLVSFFLWIATKSMKVHTYDAFVKVEVVNTPDSYSALDYNESIKVSYTGNGFSLYRFVRKMRNAKIVLDLDDYNVVSKGTNYEYSVLNKDLTNLIISEFSIKKYESIQVNLSRNYILVYTKNTIKDVDVVYNIESFICDGYMMYKDVEISNSKASISGLELFVNQCKSVDLMIPPHFCIDSDTNMDFAVHSEVEGLSISPSKINMKFYISPKQELSFVKEITTINDYLFDTPILINITANAPAILADSLSADNFLVRISDYDTIDDKIYANINVIKDMGFIKDLNFTPAQIEIPQNNE